MAVVKQATVSRWVGLSTDTKPAAAPPGSTFLEIDTLDYFLCYNGAAWTKGARNSERDDVGGWRRNGGG